MGFPRDVSKCQTNTLRLIRECGADGGVRGRPSRGPHWFCLGLSCSLALALPIVFSDAPTLVLSFLSHLLSFVLIFLWSRSQFPCEVSLKSQRCIPFYG